MWTVIWRYFVDRKNQLIIYSLSSVLMTWMYVVLFPSFKNETELFAQSMKNTPAGLNKAFGLDQLDFSTLNHFIGMEKFSLMWWVLASVLIISLIGAAFAGEVEKGTIEITLSLPISRAKVFFSRYFTGLFNILIFCFVTVFCVVPLARLYNVEYDFRPFVYLFGLDLLFMFALLGIASLTSVLVNEKGRAYFLSGSFLLVMYMINIFSGLKESLEWMKYISIFYYFNLQDAVVKGHISNAAIWVFVLIGVISTASALWLFKKRDFAV